MKTLLKVLVVMMLVIPAAALVAQTNYEVQSGTVVSVFDDQLVVKMSTGEIRQITVPAGFKFTVDGKEVGLADLTPGTQLTAVITTTKTPETVKTVTIKNGEVLKVVGNTLWVKEAGGSKTYAIPAGFKFDYNGKKVGIGELRPGYKLNAEIVYTAEKIVTDREVQIGGMAPKPAPAPLVEAAPAPVAAEPAPEPAPEALPKTGSSLPLLGLLGVMLLAAGFAVRRLI